MRAGLALAHLRDRRRQSLGGARPFASFVTEIEEKVRRALVRRLDISVGMLSVHLLGDGGIRQEALEHPNLPDDIRGELDALRHGT